jgi:hypothetical protein
LDHLEDIQSRFSALPERKSEELTEGGLFWAHLYELSLIDHLTFAFEAFGMSEYFVGLVRSPDPQDAALAEMEKDYDADSDEPLQHLAGLTNADLISIVLSIQFTLKSLAVYGRSLSALIAEGRSGRDKSFFEAISIDHSVLANPTVASRIALAQLKAEKRFFTHLRRSLKGPSKRQWPGRERLRFLWVLLRNADAPSMSPADLEHLVVKELGVYSPSATARKNLQEQYYKNRSLKDI